VRIIAGSARGRALKGPRSASIRPTQDRVRETIFNILGQWLDGQRVLDLYAGTGALGLEALSRGAVTAVLVDASKESQALCQANAEALGFAQQVTVLASRVEQAIPRLQKRSDPFHLVFADPPYDLRAAATLVESLAAAKLVHPGGILVLEHDKREEPPERAGRLVRDDVRTFGDTRVSFFRSLDPPPERDDTAAP
jgi:16S rRNA (guanine966-N2)-methyltransferase